MMKLIERPEPRDDFDSKQLLALAWEIHPAPSADRRHREEDDFDLMIRERPT
jgi:hypothetical protein